MRKDATAIYADCLGSAGIIGKVEFKYSRIEMNNSAHVIARFFLIQTLLDNLTII
jgi:hypothetical protein